MPEGTHRPGRAAPSGEKQPLVLQPSLSWHPHPLLHRLQLLVRLEPQGDVRPFPAGAPREDEVLQGVV